MQLKSSLWLNSGNRSRSKNLDRSFSDFKKSLNDRQSHILLKFKESKEPIQFELSYVD